MNALATRSATVSAILLATVALTAHAQIGGLLKKGKDAAVGKAADAAPATTVDSLPGSLTYNDLAAVEKGLEAELEAAPRVKKQAEQWQKSAEADQKAYDKALKDYDDKYEKWRRCQEKVMNEGEKEADAMARQADAANNRMAGAIDEKEIEARALKAQQAAERVANGTATAADRQAIADFQATMAGVQRLNDTVVANARAQDALSEKQKSKLAACGEEPKKPTAPASLSATPEDMLLGIGAAAAGMGGASGTGNSTGTDNATYKWKRELVIRSANLRLKDSRPDAARINSKLDEVKKTTDAMRQAGVPL